MSPVSASASKSISPDQSEHAGRISSGQSLFPGQSYQPPSIPPSMVLSSTFGGPRAHKDGSTRYWSSCYPVQNDGQLEDSECPSELDMIINTGETLQQTMTRLSPYSLSACRLDVVSSNQQTELSGVWVRGLTRDIVLTVSHFKKDPKITTNAGNTTAKVFTTLTGNLSSKNPIQCELFHDFNDPDGKSDFAIFVPCGDKKLRSPAQAIKQTDILANSTSTSGTVISFGYNTSPTAPVNNHPDPSVRDCRCLNCWQGSANLVCQQLNQNLASPSPCILAPGLRTISVGDWVSRQGKVLHTTTGWYGISGAGMYAKDGQGNLRLVALFQGGIFEKPNADANKAVVIPSDVLKRIGEAGVM